MKRLNQVTILDANRNTPRTTSGGIAIIRQFEKMPEIKHQLGQPTKLSCSFYASSPVVLNDEIKKRSVIRLGYDDGSIREYRVISTHRNYSGEQAFKVDGEDIITDLSTKQVVRKLSTSEIQFAFPMSGITANDALTKLLSTDYNAPSHIQLGSTPTEATEAIGDIQINGSTHLDAIRQVISQIDVDGIEFETSYNSTDDAWDVNFVKRIGSTTAKDINIAISGGVNNRIENTANAKSQNEFSNIIPFAGDEEDSGGIQKNFWHVTNVNVTTEDQNTVTYITLGKYFSDLYSVYDISQFYYLYNIDQEVGIGTVKLRDGDRVRIDGDVSTEVSQNDFVRFQESSTQEIYRLNDPQAEAELGIIEEPYRNEYISPYSNLIELTDHPADLSVWSNGMPKNWFKNSGNETVTEVTDDLHTINGSSSAKIEAADADGGIVAGMGALNAPNDDYALNVTGSIRNERGNYYSMWANIYIENGTVEIGFFDDTDSSYWPASYAADGTKAKSSGPGWVQLAVSGMEPAIPDGDSTFIVRSVGGAATFYLDSVTVTNSLNAQPYRNNMGPNTLWINSAKYLNRYAGRKSAAYKVRCYDPNVYDSNNNEIQIGDDIRLREGAQLDKTLRCTGLTYTENRKYGRPIKKLTLEDISRKNIGYFFDSTFQQRKSSQNILPSRGQTDFNMRTN